MFIENQYEKISYLGFTELHGAELQIDKKTYEESLKLGFDLRFYPSHQGQKNDEQMSGVYIFRVHQLFNESVRFLGKPTVTVHRSSIVQ